MKSRISFFNFTLYKKTISRFAVLSGGYLGLWLFALPLTFVNWMRFDDVPFDITETITTIGIPFAFIMAAASAMAVFSYLYKARSCVAYHSFPLKREELFGTSYLAGLSLMIIPNVITYIFTLVIITVNRGLSADAFAALNTWIIVVSIMCLFFYSLAVLLAVVVGNWFMVPVLYGIVNFTPIVVETIINEALSVLVYGFRAGDGVAEMLTPVIHMFSFRFSRWTALGHELVIENSTVVYLSCIFVLALVFTVGALLLYRKRQMESSGEIIAFAKLRPVFKYCFAVGSAIVIGAILYSVLGFYTGFAMLIAAIIGGALGYFAVVVAMKKSFKIKKADVRGFAGFALAVVLIFAAVSFDLFGIERKMPKAEKIVDATVFVSGEKISLKEGQASAEEILEIHRRIVEQKDENERRMEADIMTSSSFTGYRRITVDIRYETKTSTLRRQYTIPVSQELLNMPDSAQYSISRILNSKEYIESKFSWVFENRTPFEVSVSIYGSEALEKYVEENMSGYDQTIKDNILSGRDSNGVFAEKLVDLKPFMDALRYDVENGVYQNFNMENLFGYKAIGSASFYFTLNKPSSSGYFGGDVYDKETKSYHIDIYPGSRLERVAWYYIMGDYIKAAPIFPD